MTQSELIGYLQALFKKILPSVSKQDLLIDHARCLVKPSFLPASVPRDVIACIHFVHIKDMLMSTVRKLKSLPDPFSHFTIYADLSQAIAARWQEFRPITETLQAQQIKYSWGHPTKLLVTYRDKIVPIMTPNYGFKYLPQWGYQATYPPSNVKKHTTQHLSKDWETTPPS